MGLKIKLLTILLVTFLAKLLLSRCFINSFVGLFSIQFRHIWQSAINCITKTISKLHPPPEAKKLTAAPPKRFPIVVYGFSKVFYMHFWCYFHACCCYVLCFCLICVGRFFVYPLEIGLIKRRQPYA